MSDTNSPKLTETVELGATGIRVTPLGIGTWAWGDRLVWGYGGGSYTDDDLRSTFQAALDAGINFFDTAELYGFPSHRSEKLLGEFMQGTKQPVVIATKFFPLPWRITKPQLTNALKGSLRRLKLGRVDLYQIHWPTPSVPIKRWADALADVVQDGLALTVGVSNYNADQMKRAHDVLAKRGVPLASNQVEYSLFHRDPERNGVLDVCRDRKISLIAYSPLAMGWLTGKYSAENRPAGGVRKNWYSAEQLAKLDALIGKMREIGAAHGKTVPQVAINWTICKGTIPIPGAKNVKQLNDNAGALGWRISEGEVTALDALSTGF